jgi:hypothetical protein
MGMSSHRRTPTSSVGAVVTAGSATAYAFGGFASDEDFRGSSNVDPSELKEALDTAEKELQAAYRKVWPLREAYAEVTPPAALPARRNRTDKQALIARCPRCGGRLKDAEA